ncbi:formylglycine-generating enzyme family protein [Salinirubellus salinus]|uniref:Formylglycine-generating enzyme family protein n=1 Tax=Salinirubellus salinus TaxID=1364945 RepID=A0A9E7R5C3_9EURY|nr:formylglycine-generating enzyme family protein [Salinirubellus salinus]UWM55028.1 formylglycine-generating enzyme family protein [Salinirubellus salinus]
MTASRTDGETGRAPDDGMVWIPSGTFRMGSDEFYPEEAPTREVAVDGFWMDETPVTNAEFERFVADTDYTTFAERDPDPDDYPGADPDALVPGSAVFTSPDGPVDLREPNQWWAYVPAADWRHPFGPESTIEDRMDHPVVHVAYEDAVAYADWAGKTLPTEAEWERAARGGLEGKRFVWGDEHRPDGQVLANTWQGQFPHENTLVDGYERTSPVGAFPANGFDLYDVTGNVWEWTSDWFSADPTAGTSTSPSCCTPTNPRGVTEDQSVDPRDPSRIPRKVLKGGSHLCAPNYCFRYRPAARYPEPVDTTTNHVGFRCIVRSEE